MTADELSALQITLEDLFDRKLAPLVTDIDAGFRDLNQRMTAIEGATSAVARAMIQIGERLANIEQRLGALESRVAKLEERFEQVEAQLGRFVEGVTRGRTTDSERIAALEARVAELEARLQEKH